MFNRDKTVESFDEAARIIIQKDDEHSEVKIREIESFRMRARLTQEGDWQMSSEMRFYEKRRELNQMLIATGNEKLIKANAIKILHRIISETKIPPGQETVEKEAYREKIEEYLRYLDILSKNE